MTDKSEDYLTITDCGVSNDVVKLYNSASFHSLNEAVIILLHGFLLESGFSPKDKSSNDVYQCMPENWNANGIFKIKYTHDCCSSFTCCMRCVPMYSTVSVHGVICEAEHPETIDFKVNIKNYLKQSEEISDKFEVFCNLNELSIQFKDHFCLPLLNLLHETVGGKPLYGMMGLIDELKFCILGYLPVEGVVSMSSVNKDFHSLANSNFLWKYLFMRDFSKGSVPDIDTSSKPNWKQMYKKEYLKKNRKSSPRAFIFPRYYMPPIFDIGRDIDTDIGIYFDPPFPDVYPPHFFSQRPHFSQLL